MKKILNKLSVVIFFSLLSSDALATSCSLTPVNILFEQSDFVFEAEVISRSFIEDEDTESFWDFSRDEPACGPKIAVLKIKNIWKGRLDKTPSIYSEDSCLLLGSNLTEGETYVVFAKSAGENKSFHLIGTPGCGSIKLEKHSAKIKLKIKELADQTK